LFSEEIQEHPLKINMVPLFSYIQWEMTLLLLELNTLS
jgi:hypothetical protein